jgi:hypothetical protein
VIRLGLRLAVSGGREAVTRLVILAAAVGIGVGLLLTAVSGVNAVGAQNDRYAWLDTGVSNPLQTGSGARHGGPAAPLWTLITTDYFHGQTIYRADVAATGPAAPVPPGIPRDPGPGQYYISPALSALLRSAPAGELADRYPGRQAGLIGQAGLPSPGSLVIVVGRSVAQMSHLPGTAEVTGLNTTPPSSCGDRSNCVIRGGLGSSGTDFVLSVVALALLLPVLIFIATATRLSAARREQRFAAMRLVGATPRQVSLIAAVESTVAAVAGVAIGFGLFFVLRIPLAAIPFTGQPFFPAELALSLPDILAVAVGVPAAAAVVARLALRRVTISPLGVTRRVTPAPPRAWRVLPLLAGLADLGFFALHGKPASNSGQVAAFSSGFALIMIGLVIAGPWLTMAGTRLLARRASRPGTLIAARRLADDPRAAFRAVSGLVLALFIFTVTAALIATQDTQRVTTGYNPAASNTLVDQFSNVSQGAVPSVAGSTPPPPETVLTRLRHIPGVEGVVEFHTDRGQTIAIPQLNLMPGFPPPPAGLVSCAQLAAAPGLGRCPAGAAAAKVTAFLGDAPNGNLATFTWPAADVPARRLDSLPLASLNVVTNGSPRAIEQARTVLENAYPTGAGTPYTLGEDNASDNAALNAYQQLADVVALASLAIAGCTLAVSVAGGLAERKRPFSLLRLTGARLGMLRHVIVLESAVPLLAVAAVAIGTGFGASALYATMEMRLSLESPGAAYYVMTAAGIVLALGIILATFPVLRRITGPETARSE